MKEARRLKILVFCLLACLLSGCFWRPGQFEEKEISIGYRGEAKVKPFLAASRFLTAMGLPVEECFNLVKQPDPGVVSILPAEGDRTASSAKRLREWVRGGGHMIYLLKGGDSFTNDFAGEAKWNDEKDPDKKDEQKSPQPSDPLKEKPPEKVSGKLDDRPAASKEQSKKPGSAPAPAKDAAPGEKSDASAEDEPKAPVKKARYPFLDAMAVGVVDREQPVMSVRLNRTRFKAEIPSGKGFQVRTEVTGSTGVHASGPRGRRAFLSFPFGKGRVTLVADAKLWRNRYIGEDDHAALLWEVVRLGEDPVEVSLVRSTRVSLLDLIWQYGRRAVLSLGVFLAIWLWWTTRRFGPRLPDPQGISREFAHHLEMSGSFLWRRRALGALVSPIRHRIRSRHCLHEDGATPGSDVLARLARRSGLDERTVKRALWGDIPREAHPFTEMMKQLQILDSLT